MNPLTPCKVLLICYLAKNPGGYCNHGFCQIGYDLEAHGQGAARASLPDA